VKTNLGPTSGSVHYWQDLVGCHLLLPGCNRRLTMQATHASCSFSQWQSDFLEQQYMQWHAGCILWGMSMTTLTIPFCWDSDGVACAKFPVPFWSCTVSALTTSFLACMHACMHAWVHRNWLDWTDWHGDTALLGPVSSCCQVYHSPTDCVDMCISEQWCGCSSCCSSSSSKWKLW